jgi:hypothetical protein
MAGKFISTNSSGNKFHTANSRVGKLQGRQSQIRYTVILTLIDVNVSASSTESKY